LSAPRRERVGLSTLTVIPAGGGTGSGASTELEHQVLALHRRAVAGADDLEGLAEAVGDAQHHVWISARMVPNAGLR
jgi:hypothetical protein